MGDQLEEDWIKEDIDEDDKADWIAEEEESEDGEGGSDDNESNRSDDDQGDTKEKKKQKRKQKFLELKARKRQKIEEEQKEESESEVRQLLVPEMLELLRQHAPDSFKLSNLFDNKYSQDNFFHPVVMNATESVTKAPCPFVRALSVALPNYRKLLSETPSSKEDNGAPVILVIAASAIRATEIIKSISSKLIKCRIAKLFAKHFKVVEQIEMLSKDYYPIAIGTPNRLNKLIEMSALQLHRLKIVLIDYTPDVKNFTLLNLAEVKDDSYQLIYGPIFKEKDHLKIALIKDKASSEGEQDNLKKDKKRSNFQYQSKKKNQSNNSKRKGFSKKPATTA